MGKSRSDETISKWGQSATTVALGEPWFRVRKDKIQLGSGKIIDDYFVWESPTIATVVPVTKDGMFVICQQYRYGVDKIMYQFPAGGVGKNETPSQAALRELEEETGYTATKMTPLGQSAAYPTKMSGWHHLFLAQNAEPNGTKHADEAEPSRVELKTATELLELMQANKFQVADSLAAGLLAFRHLGL